MQISHRSEAPAPQPQDGGGPVRAHREHLPLLGKLAKPGPLAIALGDKYRQLFNCGASRWQMESLDFACHNGGPYEIALIFVDEEPVERGGLLWFCLEEIGPGAGGNFHYLTLDQLILCA